MKLLVSLAFASLLIVLGISPVRPQTATASKKTNAWEISWQVTSDTSATWGPLYSPDGKYSVFCAVTTPPEIDVRVLVQEGVVKFERNWRRARFWEIKTHLTVDGVMRTYNWLDVDSLTFSPDSKRIAYVVGTWPEGARSVVVDGQEGSKVYNEVGLFTPIFSPDSRRVAFTAKRGSNWFVVVDGREGKQYDWISAGSLAFSSDSKRFAYCAKRGDHQFGVVDDREYEGGGIPIFSPDGKRFSCVLERGRSKGTGGRKKALIVDGVEGNEYDDISYTETWPCEPADVRRIHWEMTNNSKHPVLIDRSYRPLAYWPPTANLLSRKLSLLVGHKSFFSPDSSRLAYVALQCEVASRYRYALRYRVVLDGLEGRAYDDISLLAFSPDSQHIAYSAKRGKKWLVVVDTLEEKECDDQPLSLTFSPDSRQVTYQTSRREQSVIGLSNR